MNMGNWARLLLCTSLIVVLGTACASNDDKLRSEGAIDVMAATRLSSPAEQFTRLQSIAARPYLNGNDQVVLIDRTLATGLPPSQKADVLVTLVKNPSLAVAAKGYLLERLDDGALPPESEQEVYRAMVDYPASRMYAGDEDAPAGVIDAVRGPVVPTSAELEPVPTPAEAEPVPVATPEAATSTPTEPEPITITPLPVD